MKLLLFPILSSICIAPLNNQFNAVEKPTTATHCLLINENKNKNPEITFQDGAGYKKISCVEFKNQDYCRAELENFEFDAHFTVVSATVYFSGANFKNTEKGFITSNSLKPIKHLMARCAPGSIVVFDEIKVKGPDNSITTIQGLNLSLF
jgi:GldM C-terminal domain